MIVADTGAVIALIDSDDRFHDALRPVFVAAPELWILPWAILPEVDYLLSEYLGDDVAELFFHDLASGKWAVDWGGRADLVRAQEISATYRDLRLGLVDTVVMAVAERLRAEAIATLDIRDFGAVKLEGTRRLLPRDL